jgi:pyruvate-ferredoxin/flavodoxin oxidoreductase
LLEDNAEFGYGMAIASRKKRMETYAKALDLVKDVSLSEELRKALSDWLSHFSDSEKTREVSKNLTQNLQESLGVFPQVKDLLDNSDYFVKTSHWLIGGDGWAYDIGYGGLDHVLTTGEDVNILVLDNEVYSNTGGQKSKATPRAAITRFASGGKYQTKKDLGMLAMTYGNVYVAQIAIGADYAQALKALVEAEAFPGPSLVIAYTPCITHGLKGGMREVLTEAKDAVISGYWQLYRYHPELEEAGKNPMSLDFKKQDFSKMKDFMRKQVRFSALEAQYPEKAKSLFVKTVQDAKRRLKNYAKMSGDFEKMKMSVFDEE